MIKKLLEELTTLTEAGAAKITKRLVKKIDDVFGDAWEWADMALGWMPNAEDTRSGRLPRGLDSFRGELAYVEDLAADVEEVCKKKIDTWDWNDALVIDEAIEKVLEIIKNADDVEREFGDDWQLDIESDAKDQVESDLVDLQKEFRKAAKDLLDQA